MTIYVMLDLETMGTADNAAITAIGATAYCSEKEQKVGNDFYEVVNLESSVDCGLSLDASTVIWWMNQEEEAKKIYTQESQENALDLISILYHFGEYIEEFNVKPSNIVLLGNGATFDNVILRNAFEAAGDTYPISFRNDLCYRTLNHFFKDKVEWEGRVGTYHNALDDAKTQMNHFIKILDKIGEL